MEPRYRQPGREESDPLLHGRISLAFERGTDRRLQRGDLEAFQKVGRHTHSHHAERQRLAWLAAKWRISLKTLILSSCSIRPQGDRAILAKQLNISPQQMKYVTHTEAGEGLIFYGNVVLPFVDRFPKDTELYRVMTTKPEEVSEA